MSDINISYGRQLLARLDRIPIWPFPVNVMVVVGVGFFFAFYDVLTIGISLPKIEADLHVTLAQATWAITSGLIGYIVGSFIDSRISDHFGRRLSLLLSVSAFTLGSFFSAFSFHLSWLVFWRFVSGMGIGAEIACVTTYMEEMSPQAVRGRSTTRAIAFGMYGFAVVPFVALWLVPNYAWGWRALFLIGAAGGIVIAWARTGIPRSPRWLFLKGHMDELERTVIKAEQFVIKKTGKELAEPAPVEEYAFNPDSSLNNLLQKPFLGRIVIFATIWFIYYYGNYSWLSLATSIFYHHGFKLSDSILFVAIGSLGFVLGSVIVIFLSDKFERKWLSAVIALVWSAALLTVAWFPTPVIIMIASFVATTTIAMIIPIMYIYTGENFPTRIRNTSLSITDGLGHLGGAFCGQITVFITSFFASSKMIFGMSFTAMAISGFITFVILCFGIKMTNRSLSELGKM